MNSKRTDFDNTKFEELLAAKGAKVLKMFHN